MMGDNQTTRNPRKHSTGDLHRRLKTRKLLGVGETDDGDVHRSKLSQILGHSEQLYVKLPRRLWLWQVVVALMFSGMGVWALIFPKQLFTFALSQEAGDATILPTRLYGVALISFAMIFCSTLRSKDREVIRWSLFSCDLYFIIPIILMSITLVEMGTFHQMGPRILPHRVISAGISLYYYQAMRAPPTCRPRRSLSAKQGDHFLETLTNRALAALPTTKTKDD